MNLLLVGATGTIGTALLKQISKDSQINVSLLLRNPDAYENSFGARLIKGDLGDPASLVSALEDIDTVFLNSPPEPDMVKLQSNIIDACVTKNIRKVVRISAIEAGVQAGEGEKGLSVAKWHGEIEKYISTQNIDVTNVRCSFFMQNFYGFQEPLLKESRIYGAFGQGKLAVVSVEDIAVAVHKVLLLEKARDEYRITGSEALSFDSMCEIMSTVVGRNIEYVDVGIASMKANLEALGKPDWFVKAMLEIFELYRADQGTKVYDDFYDLTGQKPVLFKDFCQTFKRILDEQ